MTMMKRFAILGLLGAGLYALATASHAHYVPTLSGWAYHSIACMIAMRQVPSQDQLPGTVTCSITPTANAVVYCAVPGNNYTFAGAAAIQPTSVTQSLADAGIQKAGGGTYVATVLGFNPVLSDYVSACPNNNWTVVAVVLEQFDSSIVVRDVSGVVASQVTASCVIAPESQGTIPASGAQYVCNVTMQHVN